MNWHQLVLGSIIYGLLLLEGNQAKTIKKRGVMDNFQDGLRVAGQMFGVNTAADVANLVAKAFANNNRNRYKPDLFSFIQNGLQFAPTQTKTSQMDESREAQQKFQETTEKQFETKPSTGATSEDAAGVNFNTPNFITSLLRLVGFDASKLGALAINALVMIASAIGNTIMGTTGSNRLLKKTSAFGKQKHGEKEAEHNAETGPEEQYSPNDHEPRSIKDASTLEWFLENSSGKMKNILKEAIHIDLANKLIDMIASYESEQGQAFCLKMLVCKSSPFIWGMQKSIRKHIEPNSFNESLNANDEDFKNVETTRLFNVNSFFTHLPSIEEYRDHGKKCEQLYSTHCNTTDLYDRKHEEF